ncbi:MULTISPECIES: DUF6691 family protein [Methylotenera]|uniref:DUF6691 family protein n=1 Tax=Methylotenera TaxID=359407 RepID=UPI000365CD27|nr:MULTISPECIES: DUF6691 family protein [Methylotenera]
MEKFNSAFAKHFVAFISGVIFALGLLISGMADPNKVLAFLDITGSWDPSLMFVMIGAIPIAYLAFRYTEDKPSAILGDEFHTVKKTEIDQKLIVGSSLFGIGWGLSGICPGPAIVILGLNIHKGIIFFAALIVGILIHEILFNMRQN